MARRKGFRAAIRRQWKSADKAFQRLDRRATKSFRRFGKSADKVIQRLDRKATKSVNRAFKRFGPKPPRQPQEAKYGYRYTVHRGKEITRKVYAKSENGAPRLALIINAQRGREGKPGLYGGAMRAEIDRVYGRRIGGITFLGAGFLVGIGNFARALGKPLQSKSAMRWMRSADQMGGSTAAAKGWNPMASFWNDVMSKDTSRSGQAMSSKSEACQKAINQEVDNMAKYVARKIEERNKKAIGAFLR